MSRLIDADALIKSIESDRNCSDMPSQWIDGVNYAIDLIELYEPTIDAVSVVRCEKCMFSKVYQNDSSGVMGRFCEAFTQVRMVSDDDFCSYGEREDE